MPAAVDATINAAATAVAAKFIIMLFLLGLCRTIATFGTPVT
jgi:hypothetical protein